MIVTRFAPSPTGPLHLGHAYAALTAADAVRIGGVFLLRIEDIDRARCRPGFVDSIVEDLMWLGLRWREPLRRQSEHMAEYAACLEDLRRRRLLYPCFCTRAEIAASATAPHDPTGAPVYPGTCRALDSGLRSERLARGDDHCWRLHLDRALGRSPLAYPTADGETISCHPERFGDVVLGRKEVPASYHLCVTHDDDSQGVTLVTRGEDLSAVTDIHRLLQALMGWKTPAYRFHRLLTGTDGKRLAKRDGARTLRSMREAGLTASELRRQLGFPT